MNNDQIKGNIEEIKGEVKAVTGRLTGNKMLEKEGNLQKDAGKIQTLFGDFKEKLSDNLNEARKEDK